MYQIILMNVVRHSFEMSKYPDEFRASFLFHYKKKHVQFSNSNFMLTDQILRIIIRFYKFSSLVFMSDILFYEFQLNYNNFFDLIIELITHKIPDRPFIVVYLK